MHSLPTNLLLRISLCLCLCLCTLPSSRAQETTYAAFLVHRAADHTAAAASALPPARLTLLGHDQAAQSGLFYHSRYVSNASRHHIPGLSSDAAADPARLAASAPPDAVLQTSALAFLSGLYPAPQGEQRETLASGVTVVAPSGSGQLVPVLTAGGADAAGAWLLSASACANARVSARVYRASAAYQSVLASTRQFYSRLLPVVRPTFAESDLSYDNAYPLWDLISVAKVHNQTILSQELLDDGTLQQLQQLASQHELGLAYDEHDAARAIAGRQLAGQIASFFTAISLNPNTPNKLGVHFDSHISFLSFFGLAGLASANANFTGIPDYASSMAFELVGPSPPINSSAVAMPDSTDLKIRFLFSDGSAGTMGTLQPYPLFGGADSAIPLRDFLTQMAPRSVSTMREWCSVCGNRDGFCAALAGGTRSAGMSNAVAGVVGALVALAVIMALQSAVAVFGGFSLVRRHSLQQKFDGDQKTPDTKKDSDSSSGYSSA